MVLSVTYEDAAIAGHAAEFLKAHGMTAQGMCLPTSVYALKPVLENAAKFGVDHINVQPNIRPRTFGECIESSGRLATVCTRSGHPGLFRTPPGPNDERSVSERFFDLMKALPELRLTADLSHYVVSREFPYPLRDDNQADLRAILDRSHAFHGRVAGPGQIQLPISFPHNEP